MNTSDGLTCSNMTGGSGFSNYLKNPFTLEDYSGNGYPVSTARAIANILWINNLTPTNNFHFMYVIYPVLDNHAPSITTIDSSTVSISNTGFNDVICFNPYSKYVTDATLLVDSSIVLYPQNLKIGFAP